MSNPIPQRVRDYTDDRSGLSVFACDNGVDTSWIELEVTTDDTGTETLKLTRAQAESLESTVLAEALPRLRGKWDWERINRRPASVGALSARVAGILEARQPVEPAPPTVEQQYTARRAREQRYSEAQAALQRAKESAGWYERHDRMARELGKQLTEARALDAGLDLSSLESEFEQVTEYAALLPGALSKVKAAEREVTDAHAWDGYNHE